MTFNNKESENNVKVPRRPGIWLIVCLAVFIYLVVSFFTYFFGSNREIYEVVEGRSESSMNSQFTAVALRSETLVNTDISGYINFFVGDATPVSVGENVYVLCQSTDWADNLNADGNVNLLDENDLKKINNTISEFDTSFDKNEYYDAYYFKYKLSSQIMDLAYGKYITDNSISADNSDVLTIGQSVCAGIMQHSVDGYEGLKIDDIGAAHFRRENYDKRIIKSNDYIETGTPAYKVVTSEEWQLVFQLTGNNDWDEYDDVKIEFVSDGLTTTGDFETFTRSGNKYGVVSLDKYMIRYVSDRFIQIRLITDSVQGLKIPKSAVGEEAFYTIPVEFLTEGRNESEIGVLKKTDSDSVVFVSLDITKNDGELCYVSQDQLNLEDIIVQTETNVTYKVYATKNLPCAYVYDGGTVSYRFVEIIDEFSGYYIISDETEYGLRVYDQILKKAEND